MPPIVVGGYHLRPQSTGKTCWELLLLLLHFCYLLFTTFISQIITIYDRVRVFINPRYITTTSASKTYTRISRPLADIKPVYDVVVIGSGYGGGIAASRMARASPVQSVCVLERGRERWPDEYPRSLWRVALELRFSGWYSLPLVKRFWFSVGRSSGLYDWTIGKALGIFSGNGLGGTSLLNAGVFLRPLPEVMKSKMWPEEMRKEGSLDKYFKDAEDMLEPQPYPHDERPTKKFQVLQKQAKAMGFWDSCYPVPITTAFEDRVNSAGVQLRASTLSGQDCIGANDGSKNSTLVTYLADAYTRGAEIFCECDVKYIKKHPEEGYLVFFQSSSGEMSWVHGKKFVFLGAGSSGSTEIALRSQQQGLSLSPQVGHGLSSNGSMLSFGYDLAVPVNANAGTASPQHPPGPTISGTIDGRQGRGKGAFLVQDGVAPTPMAALFQLVHVFLPTSASLWERLGRLVRRFMRGSNYLDNTQVMLTLGHDNANGKMTLVNDKASFDMSGMANHTEQRSLKELLEKATKALGGIYKESGVKVTVHPLGGLSMSNTGYGKDGAASDTGELFTGNGRAVHTGLAVVDGALLPGSLATNPVATICAVAERAVQTLAARAGLDLDLSIRRDLFEPDMTRASVLSFSEDMHGSTLVKGKAAPLTLSLNVKIPAPVADFRGTITGSLKCPALATDDLRIEQGEFKLFVEDPSVSLQELMIYDLYAVDTAGKVYHVIGTKSINASMAFSMRDTWRSTTTMKIEIQSAGLKSKGSVTLSLAGFFRQLRSFHIEAPGTQEKLSFAARFLWHFGTSVLRMFLLPFAPLKYPEDYRRTTKADRRHKKQPTTIQMVTASDGFESPLRMWTPTTVSNGQDLLFIPGAAVTHEIYDMHTMRKTAIEHFTALGYRCWAITHRTSTLDRSGDWKAWTTYDARLDCAAALKAIRKHNSNQRVLIIAHCVGSGALGCGILDGTVSTKWIAGIVCSQYFLHPIVSPINRVKAKLPLVGIYRFLAGDWYECNSTRDRPLIQKLLDQLLRFHPQTSRSEFCDANACHRTQLPFGRCCKHSNMSKATHDFWHELFSGVSTDAIGHLANMGVQGQLTDNEGRVLLNDKSLEALRDIPVFLWSGAENQTYSPEATLATYNLLREKFGEHAAEREVFDGFAHLCGWLSDKAAEPGSVFDRIAEELHMMVPPKGDL